MPRIASRRARPLLAAARRADAQDSCAIFNRAGQHHDPHLRHRGVRGALGRVPGFRPHHDRRFAVAATAGSLCQRLSAAPLPPPGRRTPPSSEPMPRTPGVSVGFLSAVRLDRSRPHQRRAGEFRPHHHRLGAGFRRCLTVAGRHRGRWPPSVIGTRFGTGRVRSTAHKGSMRRCKLAASRITVTRRSKRRLREKPARMRNSSAGRALPIYKMRQRCLKRLRRRRRSSPSPKVSCPAATLSAAATPVPAATNSSPAATPYTSPWVDDDLAIFRDAMARFLEAEMAICRTKREWREQQHVGPEIWRKAGALGLLCTDVAAKFGRRPAATSATKPFSTRNWRAAA